MNKKFLSAMLTVVMFFAAASAFVSCKDYDDDIKNLQAQIDDLKGKLNTIQQSIDKGAIITSCDPITNGVRIVLSNGKSYDITNGADGADGDDGKDGTSWKIENGTWWKNEGAGWVDTGLQAIASNPQIIDGYWWIGGVNTNVKAKGENGSNGSDGATPEIKDGYWWINGTNTGVRAEAKDGTSPDADVIYYVPNTNTGCFDKYVNGVMVEHTNISFITTPSGIITALKDESSITFYNVGPNSETVTLSLGGTLKSLVFLPNIYLDGIEAIEYPWIGDTLLHIVNPYPNGIKNLSHHGNANSEMQDITGSAALYDWVPNTLNRHYDASMTGRDKIAFGPETHAQKKKGAGVVFPRDEWIYGPAWAVQYHMNPASTAANYAQMAPEFNVLQPEVVYYNTRANYADENWVEITSPETFWMRQTPTYQYTKHYGIWGAVEEKTFGKYGEWAPRDGYFRETSGGKGNYGILTAGIQVDNPQYLPPYPTDSTINPYGNRDSYVSYPASTDALEEADRMTGYCRYHPYYYDKDVTVALQLNNQEDDVITSDYALLFPTRVELEGLIWAKKPMYKEPRLAGNWYPDPYNYGMENRYGDEEGWAKDEFQDCTVKDDANSRVHIWDSPEEALNDSCGAALEIGIYDELDLTEYLGVHYVKESFLHKETAPGVLNDQRFEIGTWLYGEEAAFGLHYEFQLVDYISSSNGTHDSRYAAWNDWDKTWASWQKLADPLKNAKNENNKTGILTVKNVEADGTTSPEASVTSKDREPLVRVLLMNAKQEVLLDGYILIHINYMPDNKEIIYTTQAKIFNLCDPAYMETSWSEFSNLLLHQGLDQATIRGFNQLYWADCYTGGTIQEDDDKYVTPDARYVGTTVDGHGRGYQMKIFNFGDRFGANISADAQKAMKNGYATSYQETALAGFQSNQGLGVATYYPNGEGPTNHVITWRLSQEELEWITHDLADDAYPVTVSRWVRYVAKDETYGSEVNTDSAPYPYIWVKLTLEISRIKGELFYNEKNDNYWFNYQNGVEFPGVDKGQFEWSGVKYDIKEPGASLKCTEDQPWHSFLSYNMTAKGTANHYTLGQNMANIYNGHSKYYFAPKSYEITAANGVTYVISPENKSYKQTDLNIKPNNTEDYQTKFDQLYCKYVYPHTYANVNSQYDPANVKVVQTRDKHTWNETNLKSIMQKCAIDYNAGVFNDSILYATVKGTNKSTPIARILQQAKGQVEGDISTYIPAGEIELIHWLGVDSGADGYENVVLYDILNALGYPLKADGTCDYDNSRKYINKQFRAWIGVVANNGCDVATYVAQDWRDDYDESKDFEVKIYKPCEQKEYLVSGKDTHKYNPVATFLASWERPINLNMSSLEPALDAKTGGNTIYLLDQLKLFDWRGDKPGKTGYMYDGQWWFWAFYNVKGIQVDMRPSTILTNMHQASKNTFVKLNQVTTTAHIWAGQPYMAATLATWGEGWTRVTDTNWNGIEYGIPNGSTWYAPNTATFYSEAAKENALETLMGIKTGAVNSAKKAQFGSIYYDNNGDNVEEFDLLIPITLFYEWGELRYCLKWHIDTTHGRDPNQD